MMLLLLEIIELILGVGTITYIVLNVLLGVEVLAAIAQHKENRSLTHEGPTPAFAVLIPAYNEADGIEQTLQNLLLEVESAEQIYMVADNCTDETAAISRNLGVQVFERTDVAKKGKGHALDFGLRHLTPKLYRAVVIVDADCLVSPGTLAAIVSQSIALNRPVQATYRMVLPPDPSPRDRVSAFALIVKNQVRAGGLSSLGLPILLGGTGMAFPWEALQAVNLASSHIVEDMKLGIDLAIAGYSPTLAPEAQVTSHLPSSESAATSQRTRWEHGHLQVLTTYVPQLMKAALKQRRLGLLVMALDLAIPPLALWVLTGFALTLLTGGLALLGNIAWPFAIQGVADVLLVLAILSAWMKWGRAELPLAQLLAIPLYILWKIPIYLKFLVKPEQSWVRTERDK
ncbi:MAG: glycosyltransferase family 2 protein [Cyanobacteria bacterium P01_A01_bin.123]